jgi:hypothetical protein
MILFLLLASTEPVVDIGVPLPTTQREATLQQGRVEAALHLGLIGTGNTRVHNELRFAPLDWLELRTSFMPLPTSFMARARIGSVQEGGALVFDAGLAGVDVSLDLASWAAFAEGGASFTRATGPSTTLSASARYRHRFALEGAPEHLAAVALNATYDVLPGVALSGGIGYAHALDTTVVEDVVVFAESNRPGMTWLLSKSDKESVTVPLSLTFSRTESFDFDVFATPELYPTVAWTVGAGVRVRM